VQSYVDRKIAAAPTGEFPRGAWLEVIASATEFDCIIVGVAVAETAYESVGLSPSATGWLIRRLVRAVESGAFYAEVLGIDCYHAPEPVPAVIEVQADFAELDQIVSIAVRTPSAYVRIPLWAADVPHAVDALEASVTHFASAN
jgi:hypothetical protein